MHALFNGATRNIYGAERGICLWVPREREELYFNEYGKLSGNQKICTQIKG